MSLNKYGIKMKDIKETVSASKLYLCKFDCGLKMQLFYNVETGEIHGSVDTKNTWVVYDHDSPVKYVCNIYCPCTMQSIADTIRDFYRVWQEYGNHYKMVSEFGNRYS